MADGFLGRWARRKEAVRQGKPVPPEPQQEVAARVPPAPISASPAAAGAVVSSPPAAGQGQVQGQGSEEQAPPPTLDDVAALDTRDSDFTRFVRPGVDPEVKKAALKKLFTDPHFNVMDGLDVYIDDYNKADPLPPEMLQQLASAKFLRLFEEKKDEAAPVRENSASRREAVDGPPPESVAQSGSRTEQALPPAEDHADPDLRLQQDDAPGPEGPGAGSR